VLLVDKKKNSTQSDEFRKISALVQKNTQADSAFFVKKRYRLRVV